MRLEDGFRAGVCCASRFGNEGGMSRVSRCQRHMLCKVGRSDREGAELTSYPADSHGSVLVKLEAMIISGLDRSA